MLLDYKDIIIKHYALGMSGREIADELSVSKSGVNKFLAAFKECKTLSYPLPRHCRSSLRAEGCNRGAGSQLRDAGL